METSTRQLGTWKTAASFVALASSKPRPARIFLASAFATSMPRISAGRCHRSFTFGARTLRGCASTTPLRTVPPASSTDSAVGRSFGSGCGW